MLFCCLWCNVETSCHKHFVVLSRHQQTPPLYQRSVTPYRTVVRRRRIDNTWPVTALQNAVKPDIGSESRFLPTLPAFDAPVRGGGFPSEYCHDFGTEKEWWVYTTVKKSLMICTNVTDGRTDTAWQHRPRLHSITWQKVNSLCTYDTIR